MKVETSDERHAARRRLLDLLRASVQKGPLTLSSGRTTDFYLDGRRVTLDPEGLDLVSSLAFDALRERCDAVGGPAAAAIPIVAGVGLCARRAGVPLRLFFTRSVAKSHGTQRTVEGPPLGVGDRVALVDDVATSGGSLRCAADAVGEMHGQTPRVAWVIVDRKEGAREALLEVGIELVSLFTRDELLAGGESGP